MPNIKEIEVLSEEDNCMVLRHLDRKYPGVLIQGDSLSVLLTDLREGRDLLKSPDSSEEVVEIIDDLIRQLSEICDYYFEVCKRHNIT